MTNLRACSAIFLYKFLSFRILIVRSDKSFGVAPMSTFSPFVALIPEMPTLVVTTGNFAAMDPRIFKRLPPGP